MNNKTVKNTIALAILAFSLMITVEALAYVPGVWDPQPSVQVQNNGSWTTPAFTVGADQTRINTNIQPASYLGYGATNSNTGSNQSNTNNSSANTNSNSGSTSSTNSTNKNTTSNTNTTNTNTTNKTTTNTKTTYGTNVSSTGSSNLPPIITTDGLTALSLRGSGSFMPSSVWQWLFVIILLLAIIILARLIIKSNAHSTHVVTH
ncbi:MAG: hypothetical protein WCK91_00830 [bacterium]